MYVDLSHPLYDNMPGYQFKMPDGTIEHFTMHITPLMSRDDTLPLYQNQTSFLLAKIQMYTAVGTYIDVPYHRYAEGKDLFEFPISHFIMEGVLIDATGDDHEEKIDSVLEWMDLTNKALLINFGKSDDWGTESYLNFPALSEAAIDKLITSKVKLVGVDTINIDDSSRFHRPAHSKLLRNDILIIENLTNLEKLNGHDFKVFAVPLNIKKAPNIPVRVFAEIIN